VLFKSKFEPEFVKSRSQKVAQEMRRIFSCIFSQDDFYDFSGEKKPCLTVTGIDVSSCLRYAKIFVTEYNNIDRKTLIGYLSSKSKKYRFNMAQRLKLKFVPDISFHYDPTDDYIARLDAAFSKIPSKTLTESATS
jgi:ribosome-binding factor A